MVFSQMDLNCSEKATNKNGSSKSQKTQCDTQQPEKSKDDGIHCLDNDQKKSSGMSNSTIDVVSTDSDQNEALSEAYSGLRAQDLQEAKDQLLVETADMLHVPLFTAEALLRNHEWSKETLLNAWIDDAEECCERSGVQLPNALVTSSAAATLEHDFDLDRGLEKHWKEEKSVTPSQHEAEKLTSSRLEDEELNYDLFDADGDGADSPLRLSPYGSRVDFVDEEFGELELENSPKPEDQQQALLQQRQQRVSRPKTIVQEQQTQRVSKEKHSQVSHASFASSQPHSVHSELPKPQQGLLQPHRQSRQLPLTLPLADPVVCEICSDDIPVDEEPVRVPCRHAYCRACWEQYLTVKIKEGDAHHIQCPGFDCSKLVPVDVIESLVKPEIAKKYLQYDIQAFVESHPLIKW